MSQLWVQAAPLSTSQMQNASSIDAPKSAYRQR